MLNAGESEHSVDALRDYNVFEDEHNFNGGQM